MRKQRTSTFEYTCDENNSNLDRKYLQCPWNSNYIQREFQKKKLNSLFKYSTNEVLLILRIKISIKISFLRIQKLMTFSNLKIKF